MILQLTPKDNFPQTGPLTASRPGIVAPNGIKQIETGRDYLDLSNKKGTKTGRDYLDLSNKKVIFMPYCKMFSVVFPNEQGPALL